jgi:uncharacterized protein (TIGR00369 family)
MRILTVKSNADFNRQVLNLNNRAFHLKQRLNLTTVSSDERRLSGSKKGDWPVKTWPADKQNEGKYMSLVNEVGEGLDGLGQLRALMASGRKPGILVSLNLDFVEVSAGKAVFAGTPGEHAYNPIGSVHGGYAATLLDSACGCAVHSLLSATQGYTTLELKVAYHKAITKKVGPLRAEGQVLSVGRRAAFAEARLIDANSILYASATSTLLVFEK